MKDRVSFAAIAAALQLPAQVALALLANAALIRTCTTYDLRQWYLLMALLPIGSILEFGLPSLAPRLFALKADRRATRRFIIRCAGSVCGAQCLAALALAVVLHRPTLAAGFAAGVLMRSVASLLVAVAYSRGYLVADRLYRLVASTAFNASILVIVSAGFTASQAVLASAWAITGLIAIIIAVCIYSTMEATLPPNDPAGEYSLRLRDHLRDGGMLTIASLPALFIFNLSIYYLSAWGSARDVVIYGLFLQVVNSVNVITSIAPTLAGPRMARAYASSGDSCAIVRETVRVNRVAAICVLILLAGLVQPILQAVTRDKLPIRDIAIIQAATAAFICVECLQVTVTALGIAAGIYNFYRQALASAALVVGLAYLLVPSLGYLGLISAALIAQCCTCLPFNLMITMRHMRIPKRLVLWEETLVATAAGATVAIVMATYSANSSTARTIAATASIAAAIAFVASHRSVVLSFKRMITGHALSVE